MGSAPGQRTYRHTSRWRGTQRQAILKRDRYCRACGHPGDDGQGRGLMQAHIIRPEDGGTNTTENVVLLCRSCHARHDAAARRARRAGGQP
jgi:5-methylcytosine-specific restriction endonuclease McrA